MKFYGRQSEIDTLEKTRRIAFESAAQFTVITGRRRIGKTSLILKSCENSPTVYLFVSRNSEFELCSRYVKSISESLGVFVPQGINTFKDVFRYCMEIGRTLSYNLIIDEFQEFLNISPSIYSDIQNIWDTYKNEVHVNFIVSGSLNSLIHKIFQDYREPLYGRASSYIRLMPFNTSTLKEILSDYNPGGSNEDLLSIYAITGGVPKYVEFLMNRKAFSMHDIIKEVVAENSIFIEEGNILLIQEFGKKYGNYYSILQAIASGVKEPSNISQVTGIDNINSSLKRLEEDYDLIQKCRPVLAKPASQTIRYEIKDHFLKFWFRYISRNQHLIQSGHYDELQQYIMNDYPDYSGHVLEYYFRDKLQESIAFQQIGGWWETSGKKRLVSQYELDIVGIYFNERKVLIAEVKRQRKNFNYNLFLEKVEYIKNKLFDNYIIETKCLTLEDM